jgi:hypothetical protein
MCPPFFALLAACSLLCRVFDGTHPAAVDNE